LRVAASKQYRAAVSTKKIWQIKLQQAEVEEASLHCPSKLPE
jgi:hypothetical protein